MNFSCPNVFCRFRPGPALAAFLGSLLLTAIAFHFTDAPNRDGMLYIDAARALLESGYAAARERFDWLLLPILIAATHRLTGLALEPAAYLLSALLLSAACAIMVRCSARVFPGSSWAAFLVVLALPAFNHYRDYVIREFGAWCFLALAIELALRWVERPRQASAIGGQLALACAAAFRVEMLAFFPVLLVWQFLAVKAVPPARRLAQLFLLPALALSAVLLGQLTGVLHLEGRIGVYLQAIDLSDKLARFRSHADQMADSVLAEFARSDAPYVLGFGLLMLIPFKYLKLFGLCILPFAYALVRRPTAVLARWQPFFWLSLMHVLVLAAFVTEQFFLSGRYVSLLHFLAVPLVAYGSLQMVARWPRLRPLLIGMAGLLMLDNVVSLAPPKPQYTEAARWLNDERAVRHLPLDRLYVEGRRVRYHAGIGLVKLPPRAEILAPETLIAYDLILLEEEDPANDPALAAALADGRLRLEKRFAGPGTDVLVFSPQVSGPAHKAGP